MRNSGEDALMLIAVIVIGIALILWASIIIGILWFVVSGIVAAHRYQKYFNEANALYDQAELATGAGLDADDVFRSVFGSDIGFSDNGHETPLDWVEGTVFGVTKQK
ncbi:MAG TPA: hypothetical protein VJ742_08020 [Nitrososphaera sp.]|nr:hypothetical protein [Nitrososphaera sp.]